MSLFRCATRSVATSFCAFGLVLLACQVPAHASPGSTFSYTGTVASYTVPAGVTVLKITATGGGGASGYDAPIAGANGGAGAVVTSYQRVSPGDVLTVRVGGGGQVVGAGGAATSVTGGSVIIVAGGGGAGGISDVGGSGSAGGTAAGGDGSSSGKGGLGGNSDGVGTGGSGAGPDSSCGDSAAAGSGGAGASDGGTASGSSGGGGGGGYGGGAGGASGTAQAGGTSASFARQTARAGGGGAGFGGGGGGYFSGGGGYGGGGGSVNCSSQGSGGAGGSFASPSATGYSATTFAMGTNGGDGSSSTAAGDGLVEIEELAYGGPRDVLQQIVAPETGCEAVSRPDLDWANVRSGGWGLSWAQWTNNGNGGAVCTRTLVYSTSQSKWLIG